MSKVIDRKFNILAVNPCKQNRVYTERDGIFFCAKDAALPAAIEAYVAKCDALGCEQEHIDSMVLALERVITYQRQELKLPDTNTRCELDRCIGGIGVEK